MKTHETGRPVIVLLALLAATTLVILLVAAHQVNAMKGSSARGPGDPSTSSLRVRSTQS